MIELSLGKLPSILVSTSNYHYYENNHQIYGLDWCYCNWILHSATQNRSTQFWVWIGQTIEKLGDMGSVSSPREQYGAESEKIQNSEREYAYEYHINGSLSAYKFFATKGRLAYISRSQPNRLNSQLPFSISKK